MPRNASVAQGLTLPRYAQLRPISVRLPTKKNANAATQRPRTREGAPCFSSRETFRVCIRYIGSSNVQAERRAAALKPPDLLYRKSSTHPTINEDDAARPFQVRCSRIHETGERFPLSRTPCVYARVEAQTPDSRKNLHPVTACRKARPLARALPRFESCHHCWQRPSTRIVPTRRIPAPLESSLDF
jgi:hypothetical protein